MFDRLLIANRGEIACRILRTARARGLVTIAVFSEPDADAPHVAAADLAVALRGKTPAESYLDIEQILDAARRTHAQAVHPGYGFLSENAGFARRCEEAGLVFVGPPADAIAAMGDKARAKMRMRQAGVPVVPGWDGDAQDDIASYASEVGYPLLVKASAGGGGRGMRVVRSPAELPSALASARSEATSAFGDGTLLLERLVEGARHVEVQVMADAHGAVIHLGERDCSVQRRHQKVVEEAPSPAVDAALRARMGEAACAAAAAVGYRGAGTVEFLLDPAGAFYFLEMNTRLQVEHPVTEAVTGLDLVAMQLDVARGLPLPLRQDQVEIRGHAIEVRLYAEDPAHGYLPQTGRVEAWRPSDRVRVDAGVAEGQVVSPYYDPMLAKLVAWGDDRDTARRLLARALEDTVCLGVRTNRRFLARVLLDAEFAGDRVDTSFLGRRADLCVEAAVSAETLALAATCMAGARRPLRVAHPWSQPMALDVDGERRDITSSSEGCRVGERVVQVTVPSPGRARIDGIERPFTWVETEGGAWLQHGDDEVAVRRWVPEPRSAAGAHGGAVEAPMAGRVLQVLVVEGQRVSEGDVLVVMEAMKIETRLVAPRAGRVVDLRVVAGASVSTRDRVARIEEVE